MFEAPLRVVIVEDDDGMRQAMQRMLALAGFEAEGFASAEEALTSPAASKAACLVLDVQLPGLSGFELFDRLLARGPRPPVIFITGHDDPAARRRAERLRAAFLSKPFLGTDLVDAVNAATGGKSDWNGTS